MVCKKEVIAWFRDLSAYRRIDFLCALMDCCGPLELRFLGAYVEELGRKDFDSLRESELNANDLSYLSNLTNISDIRILDKVLTSLALMNSKCQDGARVLFRTLKDHTNTILNGGRSDPQAQPETHEKVVLLAVMALNHPAFTFSQKQALRTQLSALLQAVEGQTSEEVVLHRPVEDNYDVSCPAVVPADFPLIQLDGDMDISNQCAMVVPLPATIPNDMSLLTTEIHFPKESVYIKNIEVKGLKKRLEDKRYEYTFQVHWSNGAVSNVSKTHAQLFDFQCKLLNLFPEEASDQSQERVIPYLPGKRIFSTAHKGELAEKTLPEIVEYAKQLSALPQHILECEHTVHFFQPPPDPTTGAPVYTTGPTQLTQTQATMPNMLESNQQLQQQLQQQALSSLSPTSPQMSPGDPATNLADPLVSQQVEEANKLQQHVEQVQQLQQQQGVAVDQLQQQQIQGAPALVPQPVQQNQASPSLNTTLSQMNISHHHPVNVSTPTPSQPTMQTPVSCMNTSIVTTSAVTTTAGAMNSQYYAAVNNLVPMPSSPQQPLAGLPGGQPTGQTGVMNSTEQYNPAAATGNAEQVPGLQQYKLPGTRLPYKLNSWSIYGQPNVAPPSHTAAPSPFVMPSPHMCVSGLHSPRYFPMVPHYPPPRDVVVPPIQEWLKKQRLHKYAYLFEGMTVQQVLQLTDDEIDSWNIVTGAKGRIKTQLQALRSGLNGINPQTIGLAAATGIAGVGTTGTIPSASQQQQQQQAFIAQLQQQAAIAANFTSVMSNLPPGMAYSQSLSSGKSTGSDCSSTPSSPRESSDENDRDSEGSDSSVMSSPEARPSLPKDIPGDMKLSPQPLPLSGDNNRMGQGSPRPPLASMPYMIQSPTGEVIPMALAVGRADSLLMQPPPPPGRQMDVRLPGMQMTPNGGSPVMEMASPQQTVQKATGHLSLPTSSTLTMIPRHPTPTMSMSDSNIGMANMPSPVIPAMDLAVHMMHMKGSSTPKPTTVPSPQYTPVEEPPYKASVVPSAVQTSGSVPVLSNSVASMHIGCARPDNTMANHIMNSPQGMLDHSRTMGYAPTPTSQPNFVVNPIQAPTAVTYVTTTSQSHPVAMPNNAYDTATSMPFNNNQSAYPSVSNASALCTSCGCNGTCGGTSGVHHTHTPHTFPPFSGAFLPNQLAFQQQHNFNPTNFYHQGNVGNVLPPTPTNNVMNSPIPNPTGTPGSPRYPSPMPPTPFHNTMPGDLAHYGGSGGNGSFPPGLIPPAMYLGAMGLAAAAGQRTNHIPSNHPMVPQPKKPSAITCYNCGARGHRQSECQEATMEAITQNSQYRLNFKPLPEQIDSNDS